MQFITRLSNSYTTAKHYVILSPDAPPIDQMPVQKLGQYMYNAGTLSATGAEIGSFQLPATYSLSGNYGGYGHPNARIPKVSLGNLEHDPKAEGTAVARFIMFNMTFYSGQGINNVRYHRATTSPMAWIKFDNPEETYGITPDEDGFYSFAEWDYGQDDPVVSNREDRKISVMLQCHDDRSSTICSSGSLNNASIEALYGDTWKTVLTTNALRNMWSSYNTTTAYIDEGFTKLRYVDKSASRSIGIFQLMITSTLPSTKIPPLLEGSRMYLFPDETAASYYTTNNATSVGRYFPAYIINLFGDENVFYCQGLGVTTNPAESGTKLYIPRANTTVEMFMNVAPFSVKQNRCYGGTVK